MSDNFHVTDSFRVSVEAQEARIEAAKARLISESENAMLNKFLNLYGNSHLATESKAELTQVETETSEGVAFDGSIAVTASISDNDGTKTITVTLPVKANQVDIISDADLTKMVSEATAEEIHVEFPSLESTKIEASLADFSLIDDGSDYLKVYHPSVDTGKELGVIAKEEYNKASDKQALLTSILSNSVKNTYAEQTHELSFTGSFAEPTVTVEALNDLPIITDAQVVEEPVVEEEHGFLSHASDSYRQLTESEDAVSRAAFEKSASFAVNDLVSHLQSLSYNGVRVLAVDMSADDHISVTASLFDTVGEKVVSFAMPIRDAVFALPTKDAIHKLVAETTDLKTQIAAEFEQDTLEHLQAIDELESYNKVTTEAAFEDEKIVKTAADNGGMQFVGPTDVLNIDKHTIGLPDDTEIGTKAYVDGFWWALTSKNKSNLGKEADSGSIWTFTKVAPEKGEPEIQL